MLLIHQIHAQIHINTLSPHNIIEVTLPMMPCILQGKTYDDAIL